MPPTPTAPDASSFPISPSPPYPQTPHTPDDSTSPTISPPSTGTVTPSSKLRYTTYRSSPLTSPPSFPLPDNQALASSDEGKREGHAVLESPLCDRSLWKAVGESIDEQVDEREMQLMLGEGAYDDDVEEFDAIGNLARHIFFKPSSTSPSQSPQLGRDLPPISETITEGQRAIAAADWKMTERDVSLPPLDELHSPPKTPGSRSGDRWSVPPKSPDEPLDMFSPAPRSPRPAPTPLRRSSPAGTPKTSPKLLRITNATPGDPLTLAGSDIPPINEDDVSVFTSNTKLYPSPKVGVFPLQDPLAPDTPPPVPPKLPPPVPPKSPPPVPSKDKLQYLPKKPPYKPPKSPPRPHTDEELSTPFTRRVVRVEEGLRIWARSNYAGFDNYPYNVDPFQRRVVEGQLPILSLSQYRDSLLRAVTTRRAEDWMRGKEEEAKLQRTRSLPGSSRTKVFLPKLIQQPGDHGASTFDQKKSTADPIAASPGPVGSSRRARRPNDRAHRRTRSDVAPGDTYIGEWAMEFIDSITPFPSPSPADSPFKKSSTFLRLNEESSAPPSPPMIVVDTKYLEDADPFRSNWADDEDDTIQHIEDVNDGSGHDRSVGGLVGLGISSEIEAFSEGSSTPSYAVRASDPSVSVTPAEDGESDDSDETVRHYTREQKGKGRARSISPGPKWTPPRRSATPPEQVSFFSDSDSDEDDGDDEEMVAIAKQEIANLQDVIAAQHAVKMDLESQLAEKNRRMSELQKGKGKGKSKGKGKGKGGEEEGPAASMPLPSDEGEEASIELIEEHRLALSMEYSRLEMEVQSLRGSDSEGGSDGVVEFVFREMEELKRQIEAAEREASIRFGKTPTPPSRATQSFQTPPTVPTVPDYNEGAHELANPEQERETMGIFRQGMDMIHKAAVTSWGLTMDPSMYKVNSPPTPRSTAVRSPRNHRRAPPPPLGQSRLRNAVHPNSPSFQVGAVQTRENMYDIPLVPLRRWPTIEKDEEEENGRTSPTPPGGALARGLLIRNSSASASGSGSEGSSWSSDEIKISPSRMRTYHVPEDDSTPPIVITIPTPEDRDEAVMSDPLTVEYEYDAKRPRLGGREGDSESEFAGMGGGSLGASPSIGGRRGSIEDIKGRVLSIEEEVGGGKKRRASKDAQKGVKEATGASRDMAGSGEPGRPLAPHEGARQLHRVTTRKNMMERIGPAVTPLDVEAGLDPFLPNSKSTTQNSSTTPSTRLSGNWWAESLKSSLKLGKYAKGAGELPVHVYTQSQSQIRRSIRRLPPRHALSLPLYREGRAQVGLYRRWRKWERSLMWVKGFLRGLKVVGRIWRRLAKPVLGLVVVLVLLGKLGHWQDRK